jgi:serine/threonine protein kinase/tetratricopeptide (TPR) repeat protein/DNA-binding CsgD family transcriptional regulator
MNAYVGQQLGNYRLLRLLGRGGFAEVYLGEHIYLKSQAALKILHTQLTPEQQSAFVQEGQMLVRLNHPNIVRVLDFAIEGGIPFLVMEYAPNGTLHQRHPPGTRLSPDTIVGYVRQVTSALQYAHDQGLIHRDVKPENMLLGLRNEVLLSDFGLALLASHAYSTLAQAEPSLRGTTPYLAPEQLQGKPCPQSDQYALGVVVYEWLCGRRPFSGSALEIAMQHLTASVPPLREQISDLAPAIEEVVLRALAKDPNQRFACIRDFGVAFEHACQSTYATWPTYPTPLAQIVTPQTPMDQPRSPSASLSIENIFYGRNLFFTGREHLLTSLRERLTAVRAVALTGLGGIGKTQAVVEYAYRYQSSYQAIFWTRAATRSTLIEDYVTIAGLLHLPEQQSKDQKVVVNAVKQWLTRHQDWLLILDNVEDLSLITDFLPTGSNGHILLTTRIQATGRVAPGVAIEKMDTDEASLLLLRRAKMLDPEVSLISVAPAVRTQARSIVQVMDGLPLALDQVGAYIEETGCSLSEYLELYQQYRADLLARRSSTSPDYPYTVASTWSLAFERVEQANPAAADLLRLCAFLDPDVIPEAFITEGASHLSASLAAVVNHPFRFNEAIQALRSFSLMKRDPEAKSLNVHRLVQAVLRDGMSAETKRLWAERAVHVVNAAFPEVTFANWPRCQQCLPHAQVCTALIEQYSFTFPEAARLLNQAGWYLRERGLYGQAEPLLHSALAIRETTLGPEHPDTATTLDSLALTYHYQGKYSQAEPLYEQALAIREQSLGPEHPDIATTLYNLTWLYQNRGQYSQTEPLLKRALTICEHTLGAEHPSTADILSDLGIIYTYQGQYKQAEPFFQRALAIYDHAYGQEHPDTASALQNLAWLYQHQGHYQRAEAFHQRALIIREHILEPDHPDTVKSLNHMGRLYYLQGKYTQAEPLLKRTLSSRERTLGPEHSDLAITLNDLASLYRDRGQYEQAELLYRRALAIREQALGSRSPDTATSLHHLASLYSLQGQYEQAELLYRQALTIREQALGQEHPDTATTLTQLARLYADRGQYEQAAPLLHRALTICEQRLGQEHPDTVVTLSTLASLHSLQGQHEQAGPLYQRALAIAEQTLGQEHPKTAMILDSLARLYDAQGQSEQARPLYQRALAIREHVLGHEHPDTVAVRERCTALLQKMQPTAETPQQEPSPIPAEGEDAASKKPVTPTYPAGLTAREVEVLRLVAQGLTDAQIAQQLVVTRRTINWHLTSIYSKIGVSSRSAATRYALEHQLV